MRADDRLAQPSGAPVRGLRNRWRLTALLAGALVATGGVGSVVAGAAWKDAGSVSHATFASASEFPPVVRQVPTVLGAPQVALSLHATSGTFLPTPTSVSYQWYRCDLAGANCVATSGTAADYTPGLSDAGKTLRVQAMPVNGSTSGVAVRSEPSPVVLGLLAGPSLVSPVASNSPGITGTAAVGSVLTGSTGSWIQLLGSVSYRWQRCDASGAACVAIAGATSQTYTLTAADRGVRVSFAVTVNVLNLVSATAAADTTAVVA